VLVTCQIFFAPSNAFSIQNLYPEIMMAFYNIFFTACPILIFGLFEQRVPISSLADDPAHYRSIAHNRHLSPLQFLRWNLAGLWHSAVAYLSALALFSASHLGRDGRLDDLQAFGSLVYLQVMLSVHVKLLLESRYITLFTLFSLSMSLLAILVFCLLPNSFVMPYPFTVLTEDQSLYWLFYRLFGYPSVWLCLAVGCCAALLPDMCYKVGEGLMQQARQVRDENFRRKLLYFRDLPANHEQQKRKRMGESS
jgi:magnesium-transporting ATPase (P-type)